MSMAAYCGRSRRWNGRRMRRQADDRPSGRHGSARCGAAAARPSIDSFGQCLGVHRRDRVDRLGGDVGLAGLFGDADVVRSGSHHQRGRRRVPVSASKTASSPKSRLTTQTLPLAPPSSPPAALSAIGAPGTAWTTKEPPDTTAMKAAAARRRMMVRICRIVRGSCSVMTTLLDDEGGGLAVRGFAGSMAAPVFWIRGIARRTVSSVSIRGASPLGLPYTVARSALRRLAPLRWLARCAHSRACLGIESAADPALMPLDTDVTRLLLAWSDGTQAAGGPLMDAVYDELRRLARSYLVRERRESFAAGHGAGPRGVPQAGRSAARPAGRTARTSSPWRRSVMRRLLVDHARAQGAAKRGVGDHGTARRHRRAG